MFYVIPSFPEIIQHFTSSFFQATHNSIHNLTFNLKMRWEVRHTQRWMKFFGCDENEVDDDDDMVWNFKVCPITTTAHILSHITLELFSVLSWYSFPFDENKSSEMYPNIRESHQSSQCFTVCDSLSKYCSAAKPLHHSPFLPLQNLQNDPHAGAKVNARKENFQVMR